MLFKIGFRASDALLGSKIGWLSMETGKKNCTHGHWFLYAGLKTAIKIVRLMKTSVNRTCILIETNLSYCAIFSVEPNDFVPNCCSFDVESISVLYFYRYRRRPIMPAPSSN